jgi:hypothetical protein
VSFLGVTVDDVREFERKGCGLYEGTADIIRLMRPAHLSQIPLDITAYRNELSNKNIYAK